MTDPILVTPPAELLTLAEAKAHLRVDHADEDLEIGAYIAAAVAWMDGWRGILGRCIMTQTWSHRTDRLATQVLPFPDVQSATVSYLDVAGVTQTVDAANYRVETYHGRGYIVFADAFTAPPLMPGRDDAVTISAVYGFADVPPSLKVAALMLVSHWYHHREGGTEDIPAPVKALTTPYRVGMV
jgi:uncharacterized phiE125 gp8 family phage protein